MDTGQSTEDKKARKLELQRQRRAAARIARVESTGKLTEAEATAIATALPPADPDKSIRTYDPLVCAEILDRVACGETLKAVLASGAKFPSMTAWHRWVIAHPDLREAWLAARRLKASSLFDHALGLASKLESTQYGPGDASKVNALRTAIETYKWAAAKLNPQEYGEKLPDKPTIAIQINTGLSLGDTKPELSTENGLFSYTIKAALPSPTPSGEITQPQSGPKRGEKAQGRRQEQED